MRVKWGSLIATGIVFNCFNNGGLAWEHKWQWEIARKRGVRACGKELGGPAESAEGSTSRDDWETTPLTCSGR
jgi:hypothetical protein